MKLSKQGRRVRQLADDIMRLAHGQKPDEFLAAVAVATAELVEVAYTDKDEAVEQFADIMREEISPRH